MKSFKLLANQAQSINQYNNLRTNIKRFLDQPDDDCHKSKHVAVMLYFIRQLCWRKHIVIK